MGKIRIYELARELGVENKVILTKLTEIGITGKTSHSNSLEGDEADQVRRAIIRQAIGSSPDQEKVTTKVDKVTGKTKTFVEKRKGNVIRRRKRAAEPQPAPEELEAAVEEEEGEQLEEAPLSPDSLFKSDEELAADAPAGTETGAADAETETIQAAEAGSATEQAPEEEDKQAGPKVLGKIELPKKKIVKKKESTPAFQVVTPDEDDDDDRGKGKKGKGKRKNRSSRRKEFSRGDLVDYDGRSNRRTGRARGPKKKRGAEDQEPEKIDRDAIQTRASKLVVKMDEYITVGELAQQMSMKAGELIQKLIELGVMATINQPIDQDTTTIVADEFGYKVESVTFDEQAALGLEEEVPDEAKNPRPPVVTVMGHVDHGKTSLLDKIRSSTVAAKEHGGITQHIGAYRVTLESGGTVTFVDTPGHEAFTSMRARGAQITDIVILVVAADDGVMPQTVEALNHAKAAGVEIVVAVNKMDKEGANPDKVKQQLAERGLQPEEWGGKTMFFPVSALTGEGVQELLEGLSLQAEVLELKARNTGRAVGTILEARQERGRGTVATVLVREGELSVGSIYVVGPEYGRVRSMLDHAGETIESAGPSVPVEITGLNGMPQAGDDFIVVESETIARQVAQKRAEKIQLEKIAKAAGPISLEEFSRRAQTEEPQVLNVVLKADVDGSLGAVTEALEAAGTEKVNVKVIHSGVGGVTESDVKLAIASKAIVIGFGVRAGKRAVEEAEANGVDLRFYRVIYELVDDVKKAMAGLLAPIEKEVNIATAEVRDTFTVPKVGTVAGCYVTDGKIRRGARLRLLRDSRVIHEGKMLSLRRFKDDVKEVQSGYECGISFEGYNDIKPGDVIEVFEIEQIAATL